MSNSTLSLCLTVGLLFLSVYLISQNRHILTEMSHMQTEMAHLQVKLHKLQALPATVKKLSQSIASQDSQDVRLQEALQTTELSELKSGLYTVVATVAVQKRKGGLKKKKQYTIYHIRTEVSVDGEPHPFQAGIATSGYLSTPRIYVDYNSDGVVDLDAMYEIITWLPFHQLVSRSIDPVLSQETYIAFLMNTSKSEFTTIGSISKNSNALVQGLWDAISKRASSLSVWDSTEDESAVKGNEK